VQVGTNLAVLDVIETAEARFDRPFVAINVALMWEALRSIGISDFAPGFGRLLALP
jgi:maleate cis-trans isomerase